MIVLADKETAGTVGKTRITATIDLDTYERLKYWSARHGISLNEYFREAIELRIRHENKDFQVDSLLIDRMNQMIDTVTALSSNQKSLEHVIVSGFETLTGLTRGDSNYLHDDDSDDI